MGRRAVARWEKARAELGQADHGERKMTVGKYDRLQRRMDRIEKSGRADEYPPGEDPRPWWRR